MKKKFANSSLNLPLNPSKPPLLPFAKTSHKRPMTSSNVAEGLAHVILRVEHVAVELLVRVHVAVHLHPGTLEVALRDLALLEQPLLAGGPVNINCCL